VEATKQAEASMQVLYVCINRQPICVANVLLLCCWCVANVCIDRQPICVHRGQPLPVSLTSCMQVHIYTLSQTKAHVCTHVCIYVCVCVCVYVCMYVSKYVPNRTLHPTPYTLDPTPYTLHPTPYTLHRKSFIRTYAHKDVCVYPNTHTHKLTDTHRHTQSWTLKG